MRLSGLEKWILKELRKKEFVDTDYVLKTYYADELKEIYKEMDNAKRRRDVKLLQDKIKGKRYSIRHAFSQLFLKKLVLNSREQDYNGLVESYIKNAEKQIKDVEKLIKEGHNDIFTVCWLGNLQDYLEKAKRTQIVTAKEWHKISNEYKSGLVCCGSEICSLVAPTKIKLKKVGIEEWI